VAKKKVKKSMPGNSDEPSFEAALAELERIVIELEDGELGLSDALARYELGVRHLKMCHVQLSRIERKIELLSGIDASGQPITQRFDDDCDEELTSKAAARGKRRSRSEGTPSRTNGTAEAEVDSLGRLF
jgi:exodeoxyribonuclease VII small subunit